MNLDFNKVTTDGDLEDADEEQLRSTIEQFEAAQEENAAEFEAAKEKIDEVADVEVADFQDAREDLIETITEFDEFEDSPLVDEDDLEAASFSKLREYEAYFAEQEREEGAEAEFEDMGTQAPEPDEEAEDAEFAEQVLGDIPGVNFN